MTNANAPVGQRTGWLAETSRWSLRAMVVALPLATSVHEIALAVLLATGLSQAPAVLAWLRAAPEPAAFRDREAAESEP